MSFKSKARVLANRFCEPAGFQIARFAPEYVDRAPISESMAHRQLKAFRVELQHALASFGEIDVANLPTAADVDAFRSILARCPVRQTEGGSGFATAMLLWTLVKMLKPACIVESGVFRGFSSWVLAHAAHTARQFAFDVSFSQLRYRTEGVQYYEHDWMEHEFELSSSELGLAFFDDHVDQWLRIRQAAQRGFRYCLFDDNLPLTAVQSDGSAAVPTVDMLFDDSLADGESVEWHTECGSFTYVHDSKAAEETRSLVASYTRLPDLRLALGYRPANLALVELVASASAATPPKQGVE